MGELYSSRWKSVKNYCRISIVTIPSNLKRALAHDPWCCELTPWAPHPSGLTTSNKNTAGNLGESKKQTHLGQPTQLLVNVLGLFVTSMAINMGEIRPGGLCERDLNAFARVLWAKNNSDWVPPDLFTDTNPSQISNYGCGCGLMKHDHTDFLRHNPRCWRQNCYEFQRRLGPFPKYSVRTSIHDSSDCSFYW